MADFSLLNNTAWVVAPRLLGSLLVREIGGHKLTGRIVETEAYDQADAASHSYKGQTPRTEVMFGPAGRAYVYFTYGMHYCFNVVTGPNGYGSAVLIRALEPVEGTKLMRRARGLDDVKNLTNGPAKLCQALSINKELNGHDLHESPFQLVIAKQLPHSQIVQATRIGITRDTQRPWRFYIKNSPFVSKA